MCYDKVNRLATKREIYKLVYMYTFQVFEVDPKILEFTLRDFRYKYFKLMRRYKALILTVDIKIF